MKQSSPKKEKREKRKKTLVLLDAHAILHRAYHALPSFTSPAGEPTGALYGFASMLLKIIKDFAPDYIAACYDLAAPTFRHIAYKQYKAKRPRVDDELIYQFELSKKLLEAFGIPLYAKESFEADDIIGTIVEKLKKEKDVSIIIASGDLDTLQLVEGKRVQVFTLRKGIQDTVLYDEGAVKERFGFSPRLIVDFKGLKGDPSDNIPGVKGIGEKTAIGLIQKFGTLETILSKAITRPDELKKAGVKDRVVSLLVAEKEEALFSKELASIKKDVPISFSLKETHWGQFNPEELRAFFKKVGFMSLLSRLPVSDSAGITAADAKKEIGILDPLDKKTWKVLGDSRELYWLLSANSLYIGNRHGELCEIKKEEKNRYKKNIRALIAGKIHRAFGAKDILHELYEMGIEPEWNDDLQILFWLLHPERGNSSFEEAFSILFPQEPTEFPASYAKADKMYEAMIVEADIKGLLRVYKEIEMPLITPLFLMEKEGILFDASSFGHIATHIEKEMKTLEKRIYTHAGEVFTINSPKELSRVLFEKLAFSSKRIRKTSGGKRSTRYSELIKLKNLHPIIGDVLKYRELGKLFSTYVAVLPRLVAQDGRIHSTFHQTGTATGRLSSSDPNMQNIPVRSELGDEIRRAFIAPRGSVFLACDYSQIQLRIAAFLSRDPKMLAIFERGDDVHSATAAEVFNVKESEVTSEMRRRAKIINFGILYGMGAVSLAENLEVTREEAEIFLQNYFIKFAGLSRYFEEVKQRARGNGYVETLFGRKRFLPDIMSRQPRIQHEAERMAVNMPIQGSEADLIKKAMIQVWHAIQENLALRGSAKMILQIHDELLFEIKKEVLDEALSVIPRVLEEVYPNELVSFPVERKIGPNWADLKKV